MLQKLKMDINILVTCMQLHEHIAGVSQIPEMFIIFIQFLVYSLK